MKEQAAEREEEFRKKCDEVVLDQRHKVEAGVEWNYWDEGKHGQQDWYEKLVEYAKDDLEWDDISQQNLYDLKKYCSEHFVMKEDGSVNSVYYFKC